MSVYTGSCLCGSVTYEATGEPRRVFECYCNWCQKITGGSARAYAVFDMGKVNYSGKKVYSDITWEIDSDDCERARQSGVL